MDLGMGEILLILLVALLVYGGRLPEVARSLGKTVGSVKRSLSETSAKVTRELDEVTHLPEEEDRPRTVRRVQPPAPEALATEDVSTPRPVSPSEAPPDAPPA